MSDSFMVEPTRRRVLKLLLGGALGLGGSTPAPASASAVEAPASELILGQITRIARNLQSSKYNHSTVVDERQGRYEFDCSGFVTWVLRRSAPGAYSSLLGRSKRPLARDYYHELARAPVGERTPRGVRRIARIDQAEPGDIVAWLKPALLRSPHTGHVGFLLERPRPLNTVAGGYLVRIADASSYQHQDDDRYESGRTGFGSGTILLVADPETGEPRAYGWFGLYSRWVLETSIAIGRVTR
jgi:hypothetical protein